MEHTINKSRNNPYIKFKIKSTSKYWVQYLKYSDTNLILSDNKPLDNNLTKADLINFWTSIYEKSKNKITYYTDLWFRLVIYTMGIYPYNQIDIANECSVLASLYIGLIPITTELINMFDKKLMISDIKQIKILIGQYNNKIFPLDTSTFLPSMSIFSSDPYCWIDILDNIIPDLRLKYNFGPNTSRSKSAFLSTGACVPASTGISRFSMGLGYISNNTLPSPEEIFSARTKTEYSKIFSLCDLGQMIPYYNFGIQVDKLINIIPKLETLPNISYIILQGNKHLINPETKENTRVSYCDGKHMSSLYYGLIEPGKCFEQLDYNSKEPINKIFNLLIKNLMELITKLNSNNWTGYLTHELEVRLEYISAVLSFR